MELDYCGSEKIQDPSLADVIDRLENLAPDTDSFLILGYSDGVFMQAAMGESGYTVEFREGSDATHWQTVRDDLTPAEARALFELYYRGDDRFREIAQFEPLTLGGSDEPAGPPPRNGCLAALLPGVIAFLSR